MDTRIRPAAVAGTFYPGAAEQLRHQLSQLLGETPGTAPTAMPAALVAPHAGYIYSGPTAARAYTRLRRCAPRRVVLIGPAHRVYVAGLALPSHRAFATPLGDIELDREALARLADAPEVQTNDAAHALEHSLETQLPFLLDVLDPGWKLAPILVGLDCPDRVADLVDPLLDDATLLVVSSDLSHFKAYRDAVSFDQTTLDELIHGGDQLSGDQACGHCSLNALNHLAQRHGWQASLLDYRNSGDTAGPRDRVVGYGAVSYQ